MRKDLQYLGTYQLVLLNDFSAAHKVRDILLTNWIDKIKINKLLVTKQKQNQNKTKPTNNQKEAQNKTKTYKTKTKKQK